MAGIQTSIQLFDRMTPVLQSVTNALNITISHFEQMQRLSGNSVDTSALQAARQELHNAEATVIEMEEAFRGVSRTGAEVSRSLDDVGFRANIAGQTASQAFQTVQQQQSSIAALAGVSESAISQMTEAIEQQTNEIMIMSEAIYQATNRTTQSSQRQSQQQQRQNQQQNQHLGLLQRAYRNINTHVTAVLQSHERLNRVVQSTVGESTLLGRGIRTAWQFTRELTSEAIKIPSILWKAVKAQNGLNSATGNLLSSLKGIAGAYLSFQGIKMAGDLSDNVTSVLSRLNLINDGFRTTQELSDTIMKSSFESGAGFLDTAESIAKMGLNARSAFQNNDELIAFMEQVNKTFVLGGASAQEQSNAMIQLSQAMAASALRGEELNSILDGAPGIARNIEKYMGWAEGSIKSYAEEGKVTAQVVKNAMLSMAEETNEKFNSMPTTIARTFNNIKTLALKAFTPVLQGINGLFNNQNAGRIAYDWGGAFQYIADRANVTIEKLKNITNSEAFQVFSRDIITVFSAAGAVITWVFDQIVNAFDYVVTHWEEVKPVLTGIAVALGVVTAAQWALNIAMSFNPVTLVIAGIVTLIVLFYKVVDRINKVKNTSISATGIIAGVFGGLYAVVKNTVASTWNTIATVINFIYNFSENKIAAIKVLFLDLADNALGGIQTVVQSLIELSSHVPKLSFVTEGLEKFDDWLGKHRNNAQELSQKIKIEAGFEDFLPKMEFEDVNKTVDEFYTKVAKFASGIQDTLEEFDPFKGVDGIGGKMDEMLKNLQTISQNTQDINSNLEMDKEDLKFLRTVENIKYGDKYVMPQVKIEMVNNNTIQKEIDLDNFFDKKVEEMSTILQMSAEGVHI